MTVAAEAITLCISLLVFLCFGALTLFFVAGMDLGDDPQRWIDWLKKEKAASDKATER